MGAISAEKLAWFEQVTKAGQCDFEGLMQDLVRLEPGKVMRLAKSGKKTAAGVRSTPTPIDRLTDTTIDVAKARLSQLTRSQVENGFDIAVNHDCPELR